MLADRRLSMGGPLTIRVKNIGQKAKPIVEITLNDDQQGSSIPSYTSLDEIKGEVTISTLSDTSFDDVYITFEGATRTFVEKIATTSPTNGRTEAYQNFLRLVQPNDPQLYPEPRIFEAEKTYKFPFHFVVPDRLLPQSCNHQKEDTFPEGGHLGLPPSLGDPMVATFGKSLMDDMAPDMGSIAYTIKCRITNGRGTTGKIRTLTEGSKKLRVVPAVPEEPPLNAEGGLKDDYRLRKEKSIKKGFFKSKLGRLVMESLQPTSLRLSPVRSDSCNQVTTMANVYVRFDPEDEDFQPPRLNTLQTKLKVATFYASVPQREIPTKSSDFHYSSIKGIFVETINLSSRCLANQRWQTHSPSSPTLCTPTRRDSAWSTMSTSNSNIPSPSSAYNGKTFYTARIVVPISLPKGNKVFVPSFHSCLISRIYALDLCLSLNTPSASVSDPTLHIKLPIQVSSEGSSNAQPSISPEEASAIAFTEANDIFSPRSVAPPSLQFIEQSQIDTPPSPGSGSTHRSQLSQFSGHPIPEYSVRMNGAQQRFQSLSFENEEAGEAAMAPPPGYSAFVGARNRVSSNVPGQLVQADTNNRSTRLNSFTRWGLQ